MAKEKTPDKKNLRKDSDLYEDLSGDYKITPPKKKSSKKKTKCKS